MRTSLLTALAVPALVVSTYAQASVIVVGSSPGRACYERARASDGSLAALNDCNVAFESGLLEPEDEVATLVNRGIVRLVGGDHRAAIADFDQAIARDPNQPESYLNKGSAIVRMGGSPSAAIPLFNEALARRTRKPELAYYARAIAHEMSGDLKAAYLDYQRAQRAAPTWREPAAELSRFQVRRASSSN